MQFKNKLLSGVFASAAIFGLVGTAHAVDIDVYVSTVGVGDTTDSLVDPLPFAEEVDLDAAPDRGEGVAYVSFDVETGTFPSGNVIMQLQLNGATFDGALSAANFDFDGTVGVGNASCGTNPTANVSIGGASGGNTVTFLLSNLNNCADLDFPAINIPFAMTGGADVSLQMTILTESGNVPVDATNNKLIPLIELVDAFEIDIDTTGYADVVANVQATAGPYLDFTAVGQEPIGDVEVAIDTDAAVDLDAAAITYALATDVDGASVVLTGNMAAYGGAGEVQISGVDAIISGSTATLDFVTAGPGAGEDVLSDLLSASAGGTLNASDEPVELDANGTAQIQASEYSVAVSLDLGADFVDDSLTEDVLPVTRNGTSAKLPWLASNTQAGGTGSNNFVRVSNPTDEDYGPVFATVLASSTNPALQGTQVQMAAAVDAGSEVIFTAAQLETALGNFGRGDIEISVEGQGAIIARLVQRTDGTYEINNR